MPMTLADLIADYGDYVADVCGLTTFTTPGDFATAIDRAGELLAADGATHMKAAAEDLAAAAGLLRDADALACADTRRTVLLDLAAGHLDWARDLYWTPVPTTPEEEIR